MSDLNRRDLLVALTVLTAACSISAQDTAPGTFGPSRVLRPDDHLIPSQNGAQRWSGPNGTTASGEAISMHVSIVPAGIPPPALHRIDHTELVVVQEGTLEYTHDGITDHAPAGSILYVARGTNHSIRNAGPGTARYTVLQIGGDTKKS